MYGHQVADGLFKKSCPDGGIQADAPKAGFRFVATDDGDALHRAGFALIAHRGPEMDPLAVALQARIDDAKQS